MGFSEVRLCMHGRSVMEGLSAVPAMSGAIAARVSGKPPATILRRLEQVNREVWLLLTMFLIIALMK